MEDEYGYQKEYLSYEHQIWHFLQDLVVARRPPFSDFLSVIQVAQERVPSTEKAVGTHTRGKQSHGQLRTLNMVQ